MVGRKEKMKRLLKDFRIIIWLLALVISLVVLIPTTPGVVVKSVSQNSPFKDKVFPGDIITWINEKRIKTPADLKAFENYTGSVRMIVNGKLILGYVNGSLGIEVAPVRKALKFGLDIGGGIRVLLEPVKNVSTKLLEATKEKLETRINVFGLKEATFTIIDVQGKKYIQLEMAGGSISDVKNVLEKQGYLEAFIPKIVKLSNGRGLLLVGGKKHRIEMINNTLYIDNKTVNKTFYIERIEFKFVNKTDDTLIFYAKVFDSKDVKKVCMINEPGCFVNLRCGYLRGTNKKMCYFSFGIYISQEAAERMKKLTQDMRVIYEIDRASGESRKVLENGYLLLFLDGKLIDKLSISPDLKGKLVTSAAIEGGAPTREMAKKEMRFLQTVLSSGKLPVELRIVEVNEISPVFGEEFLREVLIIGVVAEILVAIVVSLRYKNPKIIFPMLFVSLSEVLIILGVACLIGWTIDLPSLAGIIATLGTSVDAQIMIIDEAIHEKKKYYTLKERIKRAFFIIFSSAATVIVAMLPLMSAGAKVMQGFAITTILGILISVFITRPAFGKIIEELM